jgi:agmatinase
MDVGEKPYMDRNRVFFAKDIAGKQHGWADEVIGLLDGPVYVTIDLDGFDPSIVPATGTPEPGGMGYYEVLGLLRKLIASKNVVGFDVVELCPMPGNKASDFLATKLIYQILSYKYSDKA